jgi:hypothetical protein
MKNVCENCSHTILNGMEYKIYGTGYKNLCISMIRNDRGNSQDTEVDGQTRHTTLIKTLSLGTRRL